MSIIEGVRAFIASYPNMPYEPVRADYLEDKVSAYSVDAIPTDTVISEDIAGNKLKQFAFVLQSREAWSIDTTSNMANITWYEEFAEWLDTKTESGELPTLETGKTPIKIKAVDSGYLFAEGEGADRAVYQIQCVLTYEQKKGA